MIRKVCWQTAGFLTFWGVILVGMMLGGTVSGPL